MRPIINYPMVNWVDGMKVRQEDFTTMENAILARIHRTAASILNEHNYGLLDVSALPKRILHLQITPERHCCVLHLHACQAITAEGILIQLPVVTAAGIIISGNISTNWAVPKQDGVWYVMANIDCYQRIPAGEPVLEELPSRTKYMIDRLLLSVVAVHELPADGLLPGQLPVGRIIVKNHVPEVDQSYIPPCTCVGAYPLLLAAGEEIIVLLRQIHCSCQEIIEKIYSRNQQQELAIIVLYLAEHVGQVINFSLPFCQEKVGRELPFRLFALAKAIGGMWASALEQRASGNKEEVLQYFAEWAGVNAGEIETKCYELIVAVYNHLDIQLAFHSALSFLRIVQRVLSVIAKLEYIGKKPEGNIFVKEESVGLPQSSPGIRKSKWSFSE
ncbi:MAG: hypothetical protein JO154_11580 [Chitinophaga sp.]|uniref:hypothetical protein n=1 Tax=Chitinophaga sp. TaxID=1869181 RepID=UPI0025C4183F|nr:hypothetical protein [Chitinophaga sp.]MBV8253238.1 hypothetical protein [Chitinophaga sp.]